MGRRRKTDHHLPKRVYRRRGRYYWFPSPKESQRIGKTAVLLGATYEEAMVRWAEVANGLVSPNRHSMNDLMDRYMMEVAPNKSPKSYKNNLSQIKPLRQFFGHLDLQNITPVLIYQYLDSRAITPVAANREKALLSHILAYGIRWGHITTNPCRETKNLVEPRRSRYVTDEEYMTVWSIGSPTVRNMMDLSYLTGLRKADILRIKLRDISDDGVLVKIGKSRRSGVPAKEMLFEWTDELKTVVARSKKSKSVIRGMTLISTRKGQPYTTDGFSSIWQRTVAKAMREKKLIESFRFHDIRRKSATDAENLYGREFARRLLGHDDPRTTAIYISGIQRIKPLK